MAAAAGSSFINIGMAGSSVTANAINIGAVAEASNAAYNYGLYAYAPVSAGVNYAGLFQGDVNVSGNLSKAGGTFKIDHPQDPENKYLIHSFVESPDMMNVYNGNCVTDIYGNATIALPTYFESENKEFKYQLTVIDNSADFIFAKVTQEVSNNSFQIRTSKPNIKVSWQVTGVRQDPWANAHRVVPELEKSSKDKGYYIHPELYGKSDSQREGPRSGNSSQTAVQEENQTNTLQQRMLITEQEHQATNAAVQNQWVPMRMRKATSDQNASTNASLLKKE